MLFIIQSFSLTFGYYSYNRRYTTFDHFCQSSSNFKSLSIFALCFLGTLFLRIELSLPDNSILNCFQFIRSLLITYVFFNLFLSKVYVFFSLFKAQTTSMFDCKFLIEFKSSCRSFNNAFVKSFILLVF